MRLYIARFGCNQPTPRSPYIGTTADLTARLTRPLVLALKDLRIDGLRMPSFT